VTLLRGAALTFGLSKCRFAKRPGRHDITTNCEIGRELLGCFFHHLHIQLQCSFQVIGIGTLEFMNLVQHINRNPAGNYLGFYKGVFPSQ